MITDHPVIYVYKETEFEIKFNTN